jgi:hypothetical protein
VRNRDAATDGRGAEPLTLQQGLENISRIGAGKSGSLVGQLLQYLLLGRGFEAGKNSLGRYQVTEFHVFSL